VKHYVMVGEGPYPSVTVAKGPSLPGGPWYRGQLLQISVPEPLRYTLDVKPPYVPDENDDDDPVESPSSPKIFIDAEAFPVMRTDLLEALQAAGVDNLQTFKAELHDEVNDRIHDNYVAFNVVGLVSAADLGASELMPHQQSARMLDTDFASLTIDAERARELPLFRLAENCSAIIVNENVKNEVESRGIPGVVFYADGEWSG